VIGSGRAENIERGVFRGESFFFARRAAVPRVYYRTESGRRRESISRVNFYRVLYPSSYNLLLPLTIASTRSASSPLAAPSRLNVSAA